MDYDCHSALIYKTVTLFNFSPPRGSLLVFQGAAQRLHLLRSHLLPEAEAHGAGQDARARQGAASGADPAADGGPVTGRGTAAGRDGEGLPHRIRGEVRWERNCLIGYGAR